MKKLSKRELEVLNLIELGMRNKEISTTLRLDEKTISTYILRAYKKLGLSQKKNHYALIMHAKKNKVL